MDRLLELEIKKEIECSADVAWWNYWDHEHLDVVHDGYKKSDIMYDNKNFLFRVDSVRLPLLSFFHINTPIFMVQHKPDTLFTYAVQFGITSKTTINIKEINGQKCSIKMNYKFYLEGWKIILKPLLKFLIPKWNEKVWREDFNVKIRRQKVLNMNFKDFVGLPEDINERFSSKKYSISLPIPRPKNSSRDRHPLSF